MIASCFQVKHTHSSVPKACDDFAIHSTDCFKILVTRAECYDRIGTWTLDTICPIGAWYEPFVPCCSCYMFSAFFSENAQLY